MKAKIDYHHVLWDYSKGLNFLVVQWTKAVTVAPIQTPLSVCPQSKSKVTMGFPLKDMNQNMVKWKGCPCVLGLSAN